MYLCPSHPRFPSSLSLPCAASVTFPSLYPDHESLLHSPFQPPPRPTRGPPGVAALRAPCCIRLPFFPDRLPRPAPPLCVLPPLRPLGQNAARLAWRCAAKSARCDSSGVAASRRRGLALPRRHGEPKLPLAARRVVTSLRLRPNCGTTFLFNPLPRRDFEVQQGVGRASNACEVGPFY